MTAPPQTNAQGLDTSKVEVTEETFLAQIDSDMAKVEKFTLSQVTAIRTKILDLEAIFKEQPTFRMSDASQQTQQASGAASYQKQSQEEFGWNEKEIADRADEIGNDFLRLEKYVNINFMGFHKILKKHDKNLPNNPCKYFYINRLHAQAWVRGDHSDIVVRLSNIYAAIRQDHVAEENKDAAQSFQRSTTKYWIKTEDVSRVKYAILRHLPVFLQKTSTGESDSQFTNSVYVSAVSCLFFPRSPLVFIFDRKLRHSLISHLSFLCLSFSLTMTNLNSIMDVLISFRVPSLCDFVGMGQATQS